MIYESSLIFRGNRYTVARNIKHPCDGINDGFYLNVVHSLSDNEYTADIGLFVWTTTGVSWSPFRIMTICSSEV